MAKFFCCEVAYTIVILTALASRMSCQVTKKSCKPSFSIGLQATAHLRIEYAQSTSGTISSIKLRALVRLFGFLFGDFFSGAAVNTVRVQNFDKNKSSQDVFVVISGCTQGRVPSLQI